MSSVFDVYAAYYDLMYEGKNYGGEAEYVARLLREYAPEAKNLFEIGCGTGAHAEHLARLGYSVFGIDMSDQMLARADVRFEKLPPEISKRLQFAPGDARTYRGGRKFDAVISLFHVLSYQTLDSDLKAALQTAAEHLEPGGLFIFDYWYGPGVLTQKPEVRVRELQNSEVRALRRAEPVMHFNRNVVEVKYTVDVLPKNSDDVHTFHEIHPMRYFFTEELERLAQPWFKVQSHFGWMKTQAPTESDWAAVTICRRTAES